MRSILLNVAMASSSVLLLLLAAVWIDLADPATVVKVILLMILSHLHHAVILTSVHVDIEVAMLDGRRIRTTIPMQCGAEVPVGIEADSEAWQCVLSWLRDRFKLQVTTRVWLRDEDGAELSSIEALDSPQHLALVTSPGDPAPQQRLAAHQHTTSGATVAAATTPAPWCRDDSDCLTKCHGESCLLRCEASACVPCPQECNIKGRRAKGANHCPVSCTKPTLNENDAGWHSFSVPFFPPGHPTGSTGDSPLELPLAHKRRGSPIEIDSTCTEHSLSPTQCKALGEALVAVEECVPTCLGVSYLGGPRHALDFRAGSSSVFGGWCNVKGLPIDVDPGPRGSCVEQGSNPGTGTPPAYGMEISIAPELALPGEEADLRSIAYVTSDAKPHNVAGRFCNSRNITETHTEFCTRLNLVLAQLGKCLGSCRSIGELQVEKLAGAAWFLSRDSPRRVQP